CHHCGAPYPPGARHTTNDSEEQHEQDSAENSVDEYILELIEHPWAEGLGGETVLVLAEITFVNGDGKTEYAGDGEILHPIEKCLKRPEARNAFGKVAHFRRPSEIQDDERNYDTVKKVPEYEPVTTFEILVGTFASGCRHLGEISIGRGFSIERGRRLGCVRNGDDRGHLGLHGRSGLSKDK